MSERGVFAVDRGIFTDPDFADEPLTEREAFLWLVSEAAWKDHVKRVGTVRVLIGRGQLCHSIRFMAEAWGWSKSRVERFLGRLKNRDTIDVDSGTKYSVITIRKYNDFQRVSLPSRDIDGTLSGTVAGQSRDKLEDIENIKSTTLPDEQPDDFGILANKIDQAANGKIHSSSLIVIGPIVELIASGVSLELDILPAVKATAARSEKSFPLSYHLPAIKQAYERRISAGKAIPKQIDEFKAGTMMRSPDGKSFIPTTESRWRQRVNSWRAGGDWSRAEWGPKPGEAGCNAPQSVLGDERSAA